ncbi:MAG TPA: HNH endonuclease, partial [Microlunatus sp.]|nr:HNH endonuclease [Microlunatus sp.]
MNSKVPAEPVGTALEAAVDGVRTAVGHLIKVVGDGALSDLGAQGLVGFLAEMERVRNVLPVVDRAAIQHGIEQGVPAVLT